MNREPWARLLRVYIQQDQLEHWTAERVQDETSLIAMLAGLSHSWNIRPPHEALRSTACIQWAANIAREKFLCNQTRKKMFSVFLPSCCGYVFCLFSGFLFLLKKKVTKPVFFFRFLSRMFLSWLCSRAHWIMLFLFFSSPSWELMMMKPRRKKKKLNVCCLKRMI